MNRAGAYQFHDFKPPEQDMSAEVLAGLLSDPKYLSPKYFYDAKGSQLFEQITELDEYYLTRTEMALFDRYLGEIANTLGEGVCLIEYGSGSSLKIRKLLQAMSPSAYVPVDISNEHLQENAQALHADFPAMHVLPVCADFSQPFELPQAAQGLTKVGFFPGSSIGNFDPEDAQRFLRNVRNTVGQGGALLIGVDRKKAVDVLENAYNDAAGVTAAFNLNALAHLNRALQGNFNLEQFEHVARYSDALGCIQMFLRSKQAQSVTLAGEIINFAAGEAVHTENSYKYHPEEFLALAGRAGFAKVQQYSDAADLFGLFLLAGV